MKALSKRRTASFSSKRLESGLSNGLRAACSYDERQSSLLPGASIGAMKTSAKSSAFPCSRNAELFCATKVPCVIADPVASILAPLTTMPSSRSFTTWTKTSATSWIGFLRSTGGLTRTWLRKSPREANRLYQLSALVSYGA